METVIVERVPGEREICRYLPRDPQESDGNLRFYAEIKGKWRVVTLEAIRPNGKRFVNDVGDIVPSPFSDSPPKDITPCRFCPPPCLADQAEAKQQYPDSWNKCLWVKPEQERKVGPLRNLLARLRAAARAAGRMQEFPFLPAYESVFSSLDDKERIRPTEHPLCRAAGMC